MTDTQSYPPDWELPEFEADRFKEKSSPYTVVIPVLNENGRFTAQLDRMADLGLMDEFDVIIADGGSSDGSTDAGDLKKKGVNALLTKTGGGRLSAQLRMAYAWAMARGYQGVITIDGNGKDDASEIPDFARALDQGHDYVQASRFIAGGKGINTPLSRHLAIRLIHAPVISLAAGTWLTDTTQGFRAYSRRYLLDPRVQPFRAIFDRYELLAYLSVRASQIGMSTIELPSTRTYPHGEAIPTKITGLHGQLDLVATLWRTLMRRYHPRNGNSS